MRRLGFVLVLLSVCQGVQASDWYHEPSVSLSVANRLHGEDTVTSQLTALRYKTEYLGDELSLTWDGRLEYDSAYDFHNGYSQEAEQEYRHRIWIDDAYVRWATDWTDLTLGYQKAVWGQADDVRVVDVVNPLDLKNFVLFDIDEYRMSLPMLRAENSVGDWDVEIMWILDSQPNELPPQGSEFDLGFPDMIPQEEPSGTELALRLQGFVAESDVAFYAFHGYNDMPVLSMTPTSASFDYHRETMLGGSVSRPVGDMVLRGELAFFHQREFDRDDGVTQAYHQGQWLLGVDYLSGDWLFTAQYTDRRISEWTDALLAPEKDPLYTLSADGQLASDTIKLRFAISHADSNGGGQLYQSKFTYQPNAHWAWQINFDFMDGDSANFFGQFRKKDRIWLSTTYTF